MVTVQIKDYCQDCPYFEAEMTKTRVHTLEGWVVTKTIIYCKHEVYCTVLEKHIRQEIEKEKGND